MSKFSSPLRFSRAYGIDPKMLAKLGAFDPVLATDTPLFIDPVAIRQTEVPEIRNNSFARVQEFFRLLYKLLRQSHKPTDAFGQAAFDLWPRREVRGTCLGYGGGSIRGSATPKDKITGTLTRAAEIIRGGVNDPDLFLLVGLFQPGIGSDTISDLITNLIIEDLAAFNARICKKLKIDTQDFRFGDRTFKFPINPTQGKDTPVVLVPADTLRDLPIALSYGEIWTVAAENAALRREMNRHISATWEKTTAEQKEDVLQKLIESADTVHRLITVMRDASVPTYDLGRDPKGLLLWTELAYGLSQKYPRQIPPPARKDLAGLNQVVENVIAQFTFLMEQRDLWKVMQLVPSRQLEKVAQTLFFATAFAYVTSNNLDITPEAETGNGPVDFKFSTGISSRILVELKLSKNDVVKGYTGQLKTYMKAEEAKMGHYVVIDLGNMGEKWTKVQAENQIDRQAGLPYKVWRVDGRARMSASKRPAPKAPKKLPRKKSS